MPFIDREPTMSGVTSQLVTYKQTCDPIYAKWLKEMKEENHHNRKQWEYVFIMQALEENGMLAADKKGLGFGVGSEPLPALMAKRGISTLVTEINIETKNENGWVKGRNKQEYMAALNSKDICDESRFNELVYFRDVDMNYIPQDLRGFDFVWSSCSLEHLGTIDKCTEFIFNSLDCLKQGGIAAHTTEYTLSKNKTVTEGSTVFFREKDIRQIEKRLIDAGHRVTINLNKGNTFRDWKIDFPPYKKDNHLKLLVSKQWKLLVATSIGLIIKKSSN